MSVFWAVVLVVLSNVMLSLGMLLQKKHVGWIGAADRRSRGFRSQLAVWVLGFTLMNLATVPRFFALYGLPINVVNAFFGSNVAFTAVMAVFILKERMSARQILWSAFLLAALVVASARGGLPESALSRPWLVLFFAVPAVVGVACIAARRRKVSVALAVLLAACSGAMGGYMNLPMKAIQTGGLDPASIAFFIVLFFVPGFLSFALVQLAYKDAEMSVVSPAMYGFQVLWPALASYWVFDAVFDPVQALALASIALAVFLVSRPEKGRESAPAAP